MRANRKSGTYEMPYLEAILKQTKAALKKTYDGIDCLMIIWLNRLIKMN